MALNAEQFQIDTFVQNAVLLAQHSENAVVGTTLVEPVASIGGRKFIRQYGANTFTKVANRNESVDATETPRQNTLLAWDNFSLVEYFDDDDEMRAQLTMPDSPLMQTVVNGSNTKAEDVFFDNVLGTALRGSTVDGTPTSVSHDTVNQRVAATYHEDGSSTSADISYGKIRRAKAILDANEVPMQDRYLAYASRQAHILGSDSITLSRDFNMGGTLNTGNIGGSLFGFSTRQTERVNTSGNNRQVIAWQKSGHVMADSGLEVKLDVDFTKGHSKKLSVYRRLGYARLEEKKVVEMLCDETAAFGA